MTRLFTFNPKLLLRPIIAFAFAASVLCAHPAQADQITVFAASSLKGALDDVAQGYEDATEHDITISYAGSSVLARQIMLGAPADVFLSANSDWMDVLEQSDKIAPASRVNLLGNTLVLIAPVSSKPPAGFDLQNLAALLDGKRLAMGIVNAVPAGIYGKAALQHLGQWNEVAPLVAQTDNVRAALALVALGQTPLGIVYGSDALAEPKVQVIATFPPQSHPPIRYPAAIVDGGNVATAREFLNWLQSETAKGIFQTHGFITLDTQ